MGSHTTCTAYLCFALSYSAAEYACFIWKQSAHAKRHDPVLNESCRLITGCLKPTNVDNPHLFAGVDPPEIRKEVASKLERSRQAYDSRHMLFNYQLAPSRLKSRRSFLHCVEPLKEKISTWREEACKRKLKALPQSTRLNITPEERLSPGSNSGWTMWLCLNRLRTGVVRTKTELKKYGFIDTATNTTCQCGADDDTVQHRLKCLLLDESSSTTDLC